MKLADLKRLPVGTKLRLVHNLIGPCDKKRTVKTVQGQSMCLLTEDGQESWMRYPSAKDFIPQQNGFSILVGDNIAAAYEFDNE